MRPLIICILFCFTLGVRAGGPVNRSAFQAGEELKFRVFYHAWIGNLTAGYATLKVDDKISSINGEPAYHIRGEGKSRRAFNWFFKVHDRFETWFHPENQLPLKYSRRTREGNYSKDEDYIFNHDEGYVRSTRAKIKISRYTHDIISALYYARNIDFSESKKGDVIPIEFVFDDELYTSQILFDGRDTIKIDLGEFVCLRFKPMVLTGNVFDEEYPMTLWVSDDENKIPLLAESAVLVGTVRMELMDYKNLAHPLIAEIN